MQNEHTIIEQTAVSKEAHVSHDGWRLEFVTAFDLNFVIISTPPQKKNWQHWGANIMVRITVFSGVKQWSAVYVSKECSTSIFRLQEWACYGMLWYR
jgi:hypothetical protein